MIELVPAREAKLASPPSRYLRTMRACVALALALAASPAAAAAGPDISGVWWATTYSPKIQLLGGGDLPYTPAGKAAYDKNIAALKSGETIGAARRFCVPDGVPRILATPYPLEFIQPPGQTTIIYEMNHAIRVVAMDKPLPKDEELIPYPYYDGHSAGHWEGDTLVIETAGFNDKTFLDATGTPHSDAMKTVERIRKTGRRCGDGPRSGHVHARLERALCLSAAQRSQASGPRLRREASRHFLSARRPRALSTKAEDQRRVCAVLDQWLIARLPPQVCHSTLILERA
jgi:hypothetical protein